MTIEEKIQSASGEALRLALLSGLVALADNSAIKSAIRELDRQGTAPEDMHEIIMQSYLFCGFPRMLDALFNLAEIIEPARYLKNGQGELPAKLAYTAEESSRFEERGRDLIKRVYAEKYPRLEQAITDISPDIFRLMIMEGYGKTLARPDLDTITRELAVVGALTVDGRARQLLAHIRGSLNVGAEIGQVEELFGLLESFAGPEKISLARNILNKARVA